MKAIIVLAAACSIFSTVSATKCYFCYGKACDFLAVDRLKDCSETVDYIQNMLEKLSFPKIPEVLLTELKFECLSLDLNCK